MEEEGFSLRLDGGGGFQNTKSKEGQREHSEQRHRGVHGCIECPRSSEHTGRRGREAVGEKSRMKWEKRVGPGCEDPAGLRPSVVSQQLTQLCI